MERVLRLLAATIVLTFGTAAWAQQPAPGAADAPIAVSDADLETFADIYVDLQDTVSRYEAELLRAESEDQARDLQSRMQQESVAKVAEHGWTPDRYVSVAQAINADPALAEKTRTLISRRP